MNYLCLGGIILALTIIITIILMICLNPIDQNILISNFTDVNKEKIFNIGLHRTGTSSLADALTKLGYKVWHGPYFKKLENNYYEKFDALTDTQVKGKNQPDFNYKKLYEKFPNAKFILTVRKDKDKWCESIYKSNRFFKGYRLFIPEDYITTNFCKDLVYPKDIKKRISELTKQDLIDIFDKHNNDIIKFFKDNNASDKLLIFDITNGDGWEELCGFLNKPVPKNKYPKINEIDLTFKLSLYKTLGTNLNF